MRIINTHEAKTNFSKLVDAAIHGEEIIIAKAGKPVVKLVPITSIKPKRKPGSLKGKITLSKDFDAPLPDDILNLFEGE